MIKIMGISLPPLQANKPSLDAVGATASFACAVHCAVVAIFLGATPAISMLAATWVDWAFLGLSAAIGFAALVPGYRLHGLRRPLALFTFGIALLITLRVLHAGPSVPEMLTVAVAASCLIAAHWINRGARHRCACGPLHH